VIGVDDIRIRSRNFRILSRFIWQSRLRLSQRVGRK
jgi:hypothetical protein